jgi:hypothetical protein
MARWVCANFTWRSEVRVVRRTPIRPFFAEELMRDPSSTDTFPALGADGALAADANRFLDADASEAAFGDALADILAAERSRAAFLAQARRRPGGAS